jgi:hypothetical protein
MRTSEELLKLADEHITSARTADMSCVGYPAESPDNVSLAAWCNAHANIAQACVALAKEMREAEQVVTYGQADEVINTLRAIMQTLGCR